MRADLLALTEDSLAALANRGLVKRAAKQPLPEVGTDADDVVTGRYADGTTVTLPAGVGLPGASCSCGAAGVCRHVVGLVLAYQRAQHPSDPAGASDATDPGDPAERTVVAGPGAPWSPAQFSDEELTAAFGFRVVESARRAYRQGYLARVRRPGSNPVPSVELSGCSVRFMVRAELTYAHTDAAAAKHGQMITLAVWAFRAADEVAPDDPEVQLEVGGRRQEAPGAVLEEAVTLATTVLIDGARNCAGSLTTAIARTRSRLADHNVTWPVAAVDELAEQLQYYAARHAGYSPHVVASLLAELHARERAVANGGASLRSRVLGTEERAETPLRRVSLLGLGARIRGSGDGASTAEVFLVDAETGTVLVLRQTWTEDEQPTGAQIARRRVSGARIGELASGTVVSESARRSASRRLRIASNQVARTTVLRPAASWSALPAALVVRDFAAQAQAMAQLPPRLIRPRVEAEFVRVLEIGEVVSVGYDPGEQRLDAAVADQAGTVATISATYRSTSPGALDALADALESGPTLVSGALHRRQGELVLDPLALLVDGALVVPDLAPGEGAGWLAEPLGPPADPIDAVLAETLDLLAEGAHIGLQHVPPSHADRVSRVSDSLDRLGLRKLADAVRATSTHDPAAWVAAQIRLLATVEAR